MMKLVQVFLVVAAIAVLGLSLPGSNAKAETYNEAFARLSTQLRSQDPDQRANAVDQICRTGDPAAATLALDMLSREADGLAAREMGRSLSHFREGRAMTVIDRRLTTWTSQASAFHALWALTGVAVGATEEGDALLGRAINDSKAKDYYIKAAGLEAIAEANRGNLAHLVEGILKTHNKDWEEAGAIVMISACAAAARIGGGENRLKMVDALADVLEKYESERIRYFAAQACGQIAGQPAYQEYWFWRDWVKMEGNIGGDARRPSRTDQRNRPKFFGTEMVGNRVIFVIDNSGSMMGPVRVPPAPKKDEKEEEKKGETTGKGRSKGGKGEAKEPPPPPDYSKVKTKMDLAKVELIYTLEQLDENYEFNIVYYNTTHDFLIQSRKAFTKANPAGKKTYIDKVRELPANGATNIHGALMRAFRTSTRGEGRGDPALDANALLTGADTIFFLTDGYANWSDTSTPGDARTGGQPTRDKYTQPRNIADDVRRVNTFRRTVIHTVGIGPHDSGLLRTLAEQSGGIYKDMTGNAAASE